MADTTRHEPTFDAPPVVDQIDSLLRRDLDVIDVTDDRIVVDPADSADDGMALVEAATEHEPEERPALDVDLSDPAVLDTLSRLAAQLDDPQLDRLVSLVRRQPGSPS